MKCVESQVYSRSCLWGFILFYFFFPFSKPAGAAAHTFTDTDTHTHTHAHRLACPREIKSQLRGRKTNLEGQTKHLSSCVCLVGT